MAATSTPLTFDRVARIIFGVAIGMAVLGLIYYLRDALLPFGVGCLIAYMAEPLVQWNLRVTHLRRRLVPVLLSMLEIVLVVGGIVAIFMPEFTSDCHKVGDLVRRYASADTAMDFLPQGFHEFVHANVDLHNIASLLHSSDMRSALEAALSAFSSSLGAIGSVIAWGIVLLYVLFILLNYPRIMHGIRSIVPPRFRHISNPIITNVSGTMKRYFRTQALIAAIAGVLYAIGFWIVGVPLAAAWGIVCGVLFMVPYVVYLSLLPVTLLCIVVSLDSGTDFWVMWLECLAVYAVVQSFSDLYLTPRIMSKSMNLDPAVILLSLSVWGTLLGFLGVILALPLTTVAIYYYRFYILHETPQQIENSEN
ncbi:MAG: AI-2E family transporter [Muribaculaceae bacterium]|nr:AI-2E family transporter [Muribaculaceae bacterium]